MIEIKELIFCYIIINSGMFIVALAIGCADYDDEPTFKLTFRQKVFWTILIPCMSLGYSCPVLIAKSFKWFLNLRFFRWLAEDDKKDIVKDDKYKYNNYCLDCGYLSYGNYGYKDSERKCKVLDLEFLKGECPCDGKLYEN